MYDDDYYDDWQEDAARDYLSDCQQFIKNNQLDELDSMTHFYTTKIGFSDEVRSEMIVSLIDMGMAEAVKGSGPEASKLKFWLYLMIEKRGHEALFQDDLYREFVAQILKDFENSPQNNFLNKTITVLGNYSSQDNNLPLVTMIDNFFQGEVSLDFERETLRNIRFNNDRPMNALVSNPREPSLQRRHIISVRWIKDAIKTTFENREIEGILEEIHVVRQDLMRRLKIKAWPQYPSRALTNREDFEDLLALYDAEYAVIQRKADRLSLSPIQQLALFFHGVDDYDPYTQNNTSVINRLKSFARSIAQLYRDMVHNSHNQFLGPKHDNDRLGKFMYLLRPHVENWNYTRQFPLELPLNHEKDKLLRDFFFGENTPVDEKKSLIVDSREMLLNLYFNAHYDYQQLSQSRLTNHMKLFLHTYGKDEKKAEAVIEHKDKKVKFN